MKAPRAWMAPVFVVGYIVLVLLSYSVTGVDFTEIGDSVGNFALGVLVPMVVFAALLAGLTSWLGWWAPALELVAVAVVVVGIFRGRGLFSGTQPSAARVR